MQDHLTTLLGPFIVNKPVTFNLARLMLNPTLIWDYFSSGSGPLTTTVACDSLGFIRSDLVGEKSPLHLSKGQGRHLSLLFLHYIRISSI